jgi:hypothetical protein
MKRQNQTRLLKTSYCFEHIRGQSGQACPRLVCMIISRSFEQKHECVSPQIRDHPDMFPLHDVLEPARACVQACGRHHSTRAKLVLWTKAIASAINRGSQPEFGGARRDRTDDLMLAKHALSQLSYGPLRRTARISLTARRAARPNGRRELLREGPVGQRQIMVGLGRLELPTSRLSSARSNQLSYKPGFIARASSAGEDQSVWHLVHGRKRNEGGGVPHFGSD